MNELRARQGRRVVVAANFTAESIVSAMEALSRRWSLGFEVNSAPYNQLFRQLMDPKSAIAVNDSAANVFFVRIEDLVESRSMMPLELLKQLSKLAQNADDLVGAFGNASAFQVGNFVFVCPLSAGSATVPELRVGLTAVRDEFIERLTGQPNLFVFDCDGTASRFGLEVVDDDARNRLGHVPFSEEYNTALAVDALRRVDSLVRKPFKVLVLDCDNTLWDGIVGEQGVGGISLSEGRRFLQSFAVDLSARGVVVCLNSRNNKEDVWEVFDQRKDMILRRENIVASRINWLPKSENLRSLAAELELGLDSFVFVDDDPAVCAEVRSNCPEVLTVHLPESSIDLPRLFEHLWVFDRLKVTDEDRNRTRSYQDQAKRRELKRSSTGVADYLRSLDLRCEIEEIRVEDIPRVSQLTLRTNQFNATTRRMSESDVRERMSSKILGLLTVRVSDRFGDYGLVGVAGYRTEKHDLTTDMFLLSCRVLGRGVEHQVVRALGARAMAAGLDTVSIEFCPTAKNTPVLNFLQQIGEPSDHRSEGSSGFHLPTEIACGLQPTDDAPPVAGDSAGDALNSAVRDDGFRQPEYVELAGEFSSGLDLSALFVSDIDPVITPELDSAEELTKTESQLKEIFERALRKRGIRRSDSFFDIGGTSFLAVTVFVEIERTFGVSLPLSVLIDSSSIEKLACLIDGPAPNYDYKYLVPLRADGSKPPLFCFHAAGGNVLNYIELANELGDDQPVYGLQMRGGTDKSETAHDDVGEMAREYLREIRSLQPNGPYRLCGASFGGLVAYEAARHLRKAGETVSMLALIDTYAPGYGTERSDPAVFQRLKRLLGKLKFNIFYVRELPTNRKRIAYVAGRMKGQVTKARRRLIWRANKIAIDYNKATGKELPNDMLRNVKAIKHAERNYRPSPFDGRIILFRALFRPENIEFDHYLGWREHTESEFVIEDVRGNHNTAIAYPFVAEFASKFKVHLDAPADGSEANSGAGPASMAAAV